ncbi:hypothetical protein BC628DRAFT_1401038 [Trametes gibbosa]|nr:hypothetical protein BC628DRAFT_1401038 [Trametes gibbosa]
MTLATLKTLLFASLADDNEPLVIALFKDAYGVVWDADRSRAVRVQWRICRACGQHFSRATVVFKRRASTPRRMGMVFNESLPPG